MTSHMQQNVNMWNLAGFDLDELQNALSELDQNDGEINDQVAQFLSNNKIQENETDKADKMLEIYDAQLQAFDQMFKHQLPQLTGGQKEVKSGQLQAVADQKQQSPAAKAFFEMMRNNILLLKQNYAYTKKLEAQVNRKDRVKKHMMKVLHQPEEVITYQLPKQKKIIYTTSTTKPSEWMSQMNNKQTR